MSTSDFALRRSRSVMVVDSDPESLTRMSGILTQAASSSPARLRVLHARNARDVMDVISRPYVPVDLVLSSRDQLQSEEGLLEERIHELRPSLPVVCLPATDHPSGIFRMVASALRPSR
jgi:DNA-binding NtrC family response regulator